MSSKKYTDLGSILVRKLRDENYEQFLKQMNTADKLTFEEYRAQPKNPNIDPELQRLTDERYKLLTNLDEDQKIALKRLVLNILDSTAFNFLREVEENLDEDAGVGLSINGSKVEEITDELLSGTLFGEYFLWAEEHSDHGEYQH